MRTEIQRVTRYSLGGEEFNSVADVRKHVENEIGKIVDLARVASTMSGKDSIVVFDTIIEHRSRLVDLLLVSFHTHDEDSFVSEGQTVSIFTIGNKKKRGA